MTKYDKNLAIHILALLVNLYVAIYATGWQKFIAPVIIVLSILGIVYNMIMGLKEDSNDKL